jgi:CPA2 family monovalent cation:H+ antiporter-2
MEHNQELITGVAIMLVYAFAGAMIARRLNLSPIVGYLAGGIALGPFTPGPIGHEAVASQLAELGVILLMFGVGVHFSIRELLAVKWVAIPGALGQSLIATGLTIGVALAWGWNWRGGLVLGLAVSVASTVVLVRALMDRHTLETREGRIAVGWLIVEDLFSVLVLVLLPLMVDRSVHDEALAGEDIASSSSAWVVIALTFLKLGILIFLVFGIGRRVTNWLLTQAEHTGSAETETLTVLVVALGVAVGANAVFGVSYALGAFFAGVIVGGTGVGHRAAEFILPLRDIFGILFFVSVGMLFDPGTLVHSPGKVIAVCLLIMAAKPAIAAAATLALGQPLPTALTIAPALAQVGEFSFILAVVGGELGLLPANADQLIISGAILSIALNPFLMRGADRLALRLGVGAAALADAALATEGSEANTVSEQPQAA